MVRLPRGVAFFACAKKVTKEALLNSRRLVKHTSGPRAPAAARLEFVSPMGKEPLEQGKGHRLVFFGRWCAGLLSVFTDGALAAGRHFSLLVQRKVTKRNTPRPRAPAAARLGFVSPMGILGRHIRVPAQNAARRARRPAGLPTGATAADGGPKEQSQSQSQKRYRYTCLRRPVFSVAVVLALRAFVQAWQAGRVNPQSLPLLDTGAAHRTCAVLGRGRRLLAPSVITDSNNAR